MVVRRGGGGGAGGAEAGVKKVEGGGGGAVFGGVAADTPEDGFALFARAVDGTEDMAEIFGREDVGERIEKFCERGIRCGRFRKVADADFALAGSKRIRVHRAKRDGLDRIDAH